MYVSAYRSLWRAVEETVIICLYMHINRVVRDTTQTIRDFASTLSPYLNLNLSLCIALFSLQLWELCEDVTQLRIFLQICGFSYHFGYDLSLWGYQKPYLCWLPQNPISVKNLWSVTSGWEVPLQANSRSFSWQASPGRMPSLYQVQCLPRRSCGQGLSPCTLGQLCSST